MGRPQYLLWYWSIIEVWSQFRIPVLTKSTTWCTQNVHKFYFLEKLLKNIHIFLTLSFEEQSASPPAPWSFLSHSLLLTFPGIFIIKPYLPLMCIRSWWVWFEEQKPNGFPPPFSLSPILFPYLPSFPLFSLICLFHLFLKNIGESA